jgi:hypothetical protein
LGLQRWKPGQHRTKSGPRSGLHPPCQHLSMPGYRHFCFPASRHSAISAFRHLGISASRHLGISPSRHFTIPAQPPSVPLSK